MSEFTFFSPTKIHFGVGQVDSLGSIAKTLGGSCLLVTTSKDEKVLQPLYERVIYLLEAEGLDVIHFDEAVPNPTTQSIEKAIGLVRKHELNMVVGLGGGSSLDTAKAVALFHQSESIDWDSVYQTYTSPFAAYESISKPALPVIAVPTTAGTGSELTQAMVISDQNTEDKMCIFHNDVFPCHALIDPELTLTLPAALTAMTGFDAFCHAFESYVRDEANVYTRLIGIKAIENIIQALPRLMQEPRNIELRTMMSEAEMFAGISLANAAATVPHPLSEVIGGIAPRIAHGQALAALYPGFVTFQCKKTPEKCAQLARVFDRSLQDVSDSEAASALPSLVESFLEKIGLNQSLTDLGVSEEEKEKMRRHFLLGVLPFGSKEELTEIMESAF